VTRSTWRLLAVLALPLAFSPARAEETPWARSCRFTIEADGRSAPGGMVFEKRGVADLLGRLGDGTWFMVQPAQQQAHQIAPGGAGLELGGRQATVTALPGAQRGIPLVLTPTGLTFTLTGHALRVIPTPPLLGDVTFDAFLSLCPEFQDREEAYAPSQDKLKAISAAANDVTVEVYFGSWCPHCQDVLPRLIKSLREIGNPKLRVRMIGLPRQFTEDPAVKARGVRGVPTVIVYRKDVELGRFSGTETTPVEESLAKLVGG